MRLTLLLYLAAFALIAQGVAKYLAAAGVL